MFDSSAATAQAEGVRRLRQTNAYIFTTIMCETSRGNSSIHVENRIRHRPDPTEVTTEEDKTKVKSKQNQDKTSVSTAKRITRPTLMGQATSRTVADILRSKSHLVYTCRAHFIIVMNDALVLG